MSQVSRGSQGSLASQTRLLAPWEQGLCLGPSFGLQVTPSDQTWCSAKYWGTQRFISKGHFPIHTVKEKHMYKKKKMLFRKPTFLEPAICFVSLRPFLDQKGEAKVYALCFHFLPTHSLLIVLGISSPRPKKPIPLNVPSLSLSPLAASETTCQVPAKELFPEVHLTKARSTTHLGFILHSQRSEFLALDLKSKGAGEPQPT